MLEMLKSKKAQGLSLNTIVIAAIVLVVLVVIILIFTGKMGLFVESLFKETQKTCESHGGNWAEQCSLADRVFARFSNEPDTPGWVCCKSSVDLCANVNCGNWPCDPDTGQCIYI